MVTCGCVKYAQLRRHAAMTDATDVAKGNVGRSFMVDGLSNSSYDVHVNVGRPSIIGLNANDWDCIREEEITTGVKSRSQKL